MAPRQHVHYIFGFTTIPQQRVNGKKESCNKVATLNEAGWLTCFLLEKVFHELNVFVFLLMEPTGLGT